MKPSAEQQLSTSTELAIYEEQPQSFIASLGKHALHFEGFTPLEEVESAYSQLLDYLNSRVVDQPEAIRAIVEAMERSQMRLPDDHRAAGTFAFLGPTGVGKTELARALADFFGNGTPRLVKLDSANFSTPAQVSRLIGSAPGYIDGDIVPALAKEKVERDDGGFTVVLFDEIEKGCKEFYEMLLPVLDEGKLAMGRGEVTSFKNTIILFTSNLGAREMAKNKLGFGDTSNKSVDQKSLDKTGVGEFKKHFSPEFVNRLDDLIVFHKLTEQGMGNVLDYKLSALNTTYEKHFGVRLSLSEGTKKHLVEAALQTPEYGARPLVRALEQQILTTFGRNVNGGHIGEGTHVRVFHISEAPRGYKASDGKQLIFTSMPDASIKKEQPPLAIAASALEDEAVANALPVNPEDFYNIGDEYDDEFDMSMQDLDVPATYDRLPIDTEYDDEDFDLTKPPINMIDDDRYWRRPEDDEPDDDPDDRYPEDLSA